ncbi:hypothetical protein Ct61P_01979 [Colletotrichum tofieldiae]|nr:hypothetical protein Ct61P_01979 [Colletotrichum tofieldiae]
MAAAGGLEAQARAACDFGSGSGSCSGSNPSRKVYSDGGSRRIRGEGSAGDEDEQREERDRHGCLSGQLWTGMSGYATRPGAV